MIVKQLGLALGLAAATLAAAAGLRYAQGAGVLAPDGARQAIQVLIGLGFAAYANAMPKQIGPAHGSLRAQARTQAALRVGGWSFTLAGLAYAALWAFASQPVADVAGMSVVASALATTLGYAVWSFAACRTTSADQAS